MWEARHRRNGDSGDVAVPTGGWGRKPLRTSEDDRVELAPLRLQTAQPQIQHGVLRATGK